MTHILHFVYRLALWYAAESFRLTKNPSGLYRHSRDQWLRAAQSIRLNIAEGSACLGITRMV